VKKFPPKTLTGKWRFRKYMHGEHPGEVSGRSFLGVAV